jgi:FtsH-binding integral membrane protein
VLVALPALASIALTFTWGESPLSVEVDYLRQAAAGGYASDWPLGFLAATFFLAIPIFTWRVRTLISPSITKPERALAMSLALVAASLTIVLQILLLSDAPQNIVAALAIATPSLVLVTGAIVIFRRRRRPDIGLMAMIVAYTANAAMALIAFSDDPRVGWYVTLAAVILFALQVGRAEFWRADL